MDPVKGNYNATAYKDILENCVPPTLWQKFEEKPVFGRLFFFFCPMSTKLWPYLCYEVQNAHTGILGEYSLNCLVIITFFNFMNRVEWKWISSNIKKIKNLITSVI